MSKVTFTTKVSAVLQAKVEGGDVKDAIRKLSLFSDIPSTCPRCNAPTTLKHRKAQNYDYFEVICTGETQHKATLGVHNNDEQTLFYKEGEKWKSLEEIRNSADNNYQQNYPDEQPRPQAGYEPSQPQSKPQPKPQTQADKNKVSMEDTVDEDLPF